MKTKYILSLVSIVIGIFLFQLNVKAATCDQQGTCYAYNGWPGCLHSSPGGASVCNSSGCDTSVTSNPESTGYCSNIKTVTNALATTAGNNCAEIKRITFSYCARGSAVRSPIAGRLFLYSKDRGVRVNGVNFPKGLNIDTGMDLTEGQSITVTVVGSDFDNSFGWMHPRNGSEYQSSIDSNGQVLISAQLWADDPEYAVSPQHNWYLYNYSSYDFDDLGLALAVEPDMAGPYLQTIDGNVYIRGKLEMNKFPVNKTPVQKFSSFNYATNQVGGVSATLPSVSTWLSTKNYLLFSYDDINSNLTFDFSNSVKSRVDSSAISTSINSDLVLTSANYDATVGAFQVVNINGSLTFNSGSCNSKTIFFIENNLRFNANFPVIGDNACLFVVKGTTTIAPTVSSVNAYIITKNFTSEESATQLNIKGGVIAQTNATFKRDISDIVENVPSEIITYEGSRYIKTFGALLNEPTIMSIRETQAH